MTVRVKMQSTEESTQLGKRGSVSNEEDDENAQPAAKISKI